MYVAGQEVKKRNKQTRILNTKFKAFKFGIWKNLLLLLNLHQWAVRVDKWELQLYMNEQ